MLKAPVLAAVSEEAGQVDGDVVVVVVGGGVVAQVAQDHHVLAQGEHCHNTNTIKIYIQLTSGHGCSKQISSTLYFINLILRPQVYSTRQEVPGCAAYF